MREASSLASLSLSRLCSMHEIHLKFPHPHIFLVWCMWHMCVCWLLMFYIMDQWLRIKRNKSTTLSPINKFIILKAIKEPTKNNLREHWQLAIGFAMLNSNFAVNLKTTHPPLLNNDRGQFTFLKKKWHYCTFVPP